MGSDNLLQTLREHASSRKTGAGSYTGDITSKEAWDYITNAPAAVIDVRTEPEWKFSGLPSLEGTQGALHCIEWVHYPDFEANPEFLTHLHQQVANQEMPVFFLCKTGGRSFHAANTAAETGYAHSFNIAHGFEGDHNTQQQRGRVNGWKAEGLPWQQA